MRNIIVCLWALNFIQSITQIIVFALGEKVNWMLLGSNFPLMFIYAYILHMLDKNSEEAEKK